MTVIDKMLEQSRAHHLAPVVRKPLSWTGDEGVLTWDPAPGADPELRPTTFVLESPTKKITCTIEKKRNADTPRR